MQNIIFQKSKTQTHLTQIQLIKIKFANKLNQYKLYKNILQGLLIATF